MRAAATMCRGILTCLLLCPAILLGGTISIELTPQTECRDGKVTALVVVRSKGSAPACSLAVEAQLAGRWQISPTYKRLSPGRQREFTFDFDMPRPAGVHTLTVRATYTDVNGYPFSAVRIVPVVTALPEDGPPSVEIHPAAMELRDTGTLAVTILSKARTAISGTVRLALPDALDTSSGPLPVSLEPGATQEVRFPVASASGIAGGRYALAAVFDWVDADGLHHSVSDSASVTFLPRPLDRFMPERTGGLVAALVLLVACGCLRAWQARHGRPVWMDSPGLAVAGQALVWGLLFAWLLYRLPPSLLLRDALPIGGDTPAHNYLASHLRHTLFSGQGIISWASGWWCGFPMFQYYFPLPYLLMALAGTLVPANIAFKLVSMVGIFLLPVAAWQTARWFRMPRPVPLLLAIAMLPFLFVRSHTMWGVNVFSTLAGMIANSLSFPLMLLFLGACHRDLEDGRMRLRTILLGVALTASHFFTTLMGGLAVAGLFCMRRPARMRQSLGILAAEAILVFLLMAWWLIPLVLKQEYAIDFGSDWKVSLFRTLPLYALWLSPFAVLAIVQGIRERRSFVLILVLLGTASVLLFHFGYRYVSPVFVNVRLWPFLCFAVLALEACGLGFVIRDNRGQFLAVLALAVLALTAGMSRPAEATFWARWNYGDVQRVPLDEVLESLILPLDGTPGRLANDLHTDNHAFLGTTRIFEAVPHLVRKPILEGGIVNSAAGALYSYYVQGETSKQCAGYPSLVRPPTFNITNAMAHLELFNVKHFVACWNKTQKVMDRTPGWKQLASCRRWKLYELTTHDGRYVTIPRFDPVPARVTDWKRSSLDWLYTIQAVDKPFVLLDPGTPWSDPERTPVTEDVFRSTLASLSNAPSSDPWFQVPCSVTGVVEEAVEDNRIRFRTRAIGRPHIIKCTWFPNWKVRGADAVYRVTPCFMLVYPRQEEVELYYGATNADIAGWILTGLGGLILAGWLVGARWAVRRQDPGKPGGSGTA